MEKPKPPYIVIAFGEVDRIIGSPGYGKQQVITDIAGFTTSEALNLVTALQANLTAQLIQEHQAQQNRIQELTKLNIEK